MELMIKRMSPELADDYLEFFDHKAFSDGSPYYPCYCNAFYMTAEQILKEWIKPAEAAGNGIEGMKAALRKSAEGMLAQGKIQGYLAYDNGEPVGWCNANDRKNYVRVGEFNPADATTGRYVSDDGTEKVKSVACFEIAPGYRGRGIAAALLARVCEDAAKDGYDKVEAYPLKRETKEPLDFTGPVCLYEKAGFVCTEKQGNLLVMQKDLRK